MVSSASGRYEYRIAKRWRRFVYITTPPLLLLLVGVPAWEWWEHTASLSALLAYSVLPGALALVFLYGLAEVLKGRIIIDNQRIIQVTSYNTVSLAFEEIKGYQVSRNYLRLLPADIRKPTIRISLLTEQLDEIFDWVADYYPNLNDAPAAGNPVTEPAPFAEPTKAYFQLAEAYQTAQLLNRASWVVAAGLLFYPKPYTILVTAGLLLPLAAIAAQWVYAGLLQPDEPDNSKTPSLGVALIVPAVGLFVRMMLDAELVRTAPIQPWAYSIGGGFAVLLLVACRKQLVGKQGDAGQAIIIFTAALLYGYSAPVAYNVAFDTSQPTHHTSVVLSKYLNSDELPGFTARVQAWGPFPQPVAVHVGRAHYRQLTAGTRIRIRLMQGRLGLPWFVVVHEATPYPAAQVVR